LTDGVNRAAEDSGGRKHGGRSLYVSIYIRRSDGINVDTWRDGWRMRLVRRPRTETDNRKDTCHSPFTACWPRPAMTDLRTGRCIYITEQELIRRWDSERELLRSAPGSYPNWLK